MLKKIKPCEVYADVAGSKVPGHGQLAQVVNAQQGMFYILEQEENSDNGMLKLFSAYAYGEELKSKKAQRRKRKRAESVRTLFLFLFLEELFFWLMYNAQMKQAFFQLPTILHFPFGIHVSIC